MLWLALLSPVGWTVQPSMLPQLRPAASAAVSPSVLTMSATTEKKNFMDRVKEINESNKMKSVKKEAPKVRPKRMPKDIIELTQNFKKEYPQRDLEQLWGAMLACYGTEELARQAAFENPQIINPSYSFCNTMLSSRDVLFNMMGKEEAIDIMLKNPGVLQCGPALDTLGPDEIKGFANIRNFGNKIPESARTIVISLTIFFTLFPVFAQYIPGLEDSPFLNILKPLVGILFAVLIEGSRIAIVGTIVKGKMSGDKRIDQARENEMRRMGRGKK